MGPQIFVFSAICERKRYSTPRHKLPNCYGVPMKLQYGVMFTCVIIINTFYYYKNITTDLKMDTKETTKT